MASAKPVKVKLVLYNVDDNNMNRGQHGEFAVVLVALVVCLGCTSVLRDNPENNATTPSHIVTASEAMQSRRVWFGWYENRQALIIQLATNDAPVPVRLHGQLSLIVYPMAEPYGFYHLVDNHNHAVLSAIRADELIALIRKTEGPVDYYTACACGPTIGSYGSAEVMKILDYIHSSGRAGAFYMIGCCIGVGGANPRKWPDDLLRKLGKNKQ